MPTSPFPNCSVPVLPPDAARGGRGAAVAAAGGEKGGQGGRAAGQGHELAPRDGVFDHASDRAVRGRRGWLLAFLALRHVVSPRWFALLSPLYATPERADHSVLGDRFGFGVNHRGRRPRRRGMRSPRLPIRLPALLLLAALLCISRLRWQRQLRLHSVWRRRPEGGLDQELRLRPRRPDGRQGDDGRVHQRGLDQPHRDGDRRGRCSTPARSPRARPRASPWTSRGPSPSSAPSTPS